MNCRRCTSQRIAYLRAKCDDRCIISIGDGPRLDGYVPRDMNIGGGDYLELGYCLDCGQIQDTFPVDVTRLEEDAA